MEKETSWSKFVSLSLCLQLFYLFPFFCFSKLSFCLSIYLLVALELFVVSIIARHLDLIVKQVSNFYN